ncbi:MAG TPA: methyltransferase domain-containing protein [Bryobacteraceae bacterium]|nr:methyltransferase domain-containing protein [Bryobacteraceae bacterium]
MIRLTSDTEKRQQRFDSAVLRAVCRDAAGRFRLQYGADVERYRLIVTESVKAYIERFQNELGRISAGNEVCRDLGAKAASYLDWLQWTFWDLPHFAVALRLPEQDLGRAVTTCGMAYLASRILDDVIDRHFSYKGRHETILAMFEKSRAPNQRPEGLTILAGLLVCFDGLSLLADKDDPASRTMLQQTIESLRLAAVGAVMELSPRETWNTEFYRRLVDLKNVAFWRALYAGIDPGRKSPLYPFLERYYAVAQKINDVQDFAEDERRGQPNLLSVYGTTVDAEREIGADLSELAAMAETLPELERLVALLKIGDSLEECIRLKLFQTCEEPLSPAASKPAPLQLSWYSTLEEVIERLGPECLCAADCMVCGSANRRRLFEKQGFSYHRCRDCGHMYVSPRISSAISGRIGLELDAEDYVSDLLEVQRFYAAAICHLLRARAPGPRLLDIGFGRGYVLQLAKSYGFESYGIESSPRQIHALRPQFGGRLHLVESSDEDLPWEGFDAVVLSHVLEHLERPQELLGKIFRAMVPDGVLYLAVPDCDSVQFQLFGKRWDVISPLAHFQYFREETLTRLLKTCLFDNIERVNPEPVREEIAPRWMRHLRKLGATDAGELALICRRPPL